jgi:hypothetical protein
MGATKNKDRPSIKYSKSKLTGATRTDDEWKQRIETAQGEIRIHEAISYGEERYEMRLCQLAVVSQGSLGTVRYGDDDVE